MVQLLYIKLHKTRPVKYEICIIIVSWNNEKDIEECLQSILSQDTTITYKVILIDNASTDKTIEIAQKFSGQIDIIKNKKNYYLSPANNQGIKYAIKQYNPSFIMVLNPDTISAYNLISTLYTKIVNNDNICAVGPKIIFHNNHLEGKINSAGIFYDGFKQAYDIGFEQDDQGQYDADAEVFGVSGACILFRTKALKNAGFYWEKIRLYMDELELFIRMQKLGYKVLYTGSTVIKHKWMQSTNTNKILILEKYKSWAWLLIALRHYKFRSKIAMIIKYIKNLFNVKSKSHF